MICGDVGSLVGRTVSVLHIRISEDRDDPPYLCEFLGAWLPGSISTTDLTFPTILKSAVVPRKREHDNDSQEKAPRSTRIPQFCRP